MGSSTDVEPDRTNLDPEAAHELRNLLTVILGFTELVIDDLGPDHASADGLQAVRRSAERARALVGGPSAAAQGSKR